MSGLHPAYTCSEFDWVTLCTYGLDACDVVVSVRLIEGGSGSHSISSSAPRGGPSGCLSAMLQRWCVRTRHRRNETVLNTTHNDSKRPDKDAQL